MLVRRFQPSWRHSVTSAQEHPAQSREGAITMSQSRLTRITRSRGLSLASCALCVVALAATASARTVAADSGAASGPSPFTPGKVFTFLFLTLGPFKLLGPFYGLTHGRDAGYRMRLALGGLFYSVLALVAAATLGQSVLGKWNTSPRVLQLTAGLILFLVALRPVLEQYGSREEKEIAAASTSSPSSVMFSPLAFPSIVTPYGVALLMLLFAALPDRMPQLLGVAGLVFVINLLAMLSAHRVMQVPLVAPALRVVGIVMAVLLVAVGVQTTTDAGRALRAGAAR
jgi:multiple antibiotic resistance protein